MTRVDGAAAAATVDGGRRRPMSSDGGAAPPRRVMAALALVLAVAVVALYGYGARGFGLAEPDETRYAEIGREMVVSGEWLSPHVNYVKYSQKPPLVFWATALSFLAFGQHEWAVRLPSLLGGLVTLLLTGWLAARLYGGATGLLACAVLAFTPLFGFMAIVLTLDMLLTACLTLALVGVWRAWEGGGDRRWVRLASVATALGVLVKGPVAVLLVGAVAALFLLTHGGWRALRPWCDWRGLALGAAIALPWFAIASWRDPAFWHYFIIEQHFVRFTSQKQHREPFWFFLPVVLGALAPWSLAAAFDPGLARGLLDPRRWAPATRFLALWAVVIVGFFSLSHTKLVTYALPALPPLAILLARLLLHGLAVGRTAGLARAAWLLTIGAPVLGLVAAILPWLASHYRVPILVPYLAVGALPMLLAGVATLHLLARRRPDAALVAFAAGWALVFAVAVSGRGVVNDYRSLALAARATLGPDDRLALYRNFVQGMVYYTGRRNIMIGPPGEMTFGSQQGEQSAWFWRDDAAWISREWAGPGRLLVLFNRRDLDRLRPLLVPPPIELASQDKKVLVANR